MSVESVRDEFLARNRFCVLGTLRKDGRARLSPMAYVYDAGKLLISTTRTRGGGRTAKRDPRVTVCCLDPENRRDYITVYGRVDVLESEADSLDLWTKMRGHTLEGEELARERQRYVEEGRVVLRITPEEYFLGASLMEKAAQAG